jgi:WD40 repeat protein
MFSCDLKLLASYSSNRNVHVWDISNGQCMQTFTANGYQGARDFFEKNPDLKLFDGTVGLTSFCLDGPYWYTHKAQSRSQGYGLSQDGRCITWDSECLLWLPPEYRPAERSIPVVSGSTLCINCASGRVLFFAFDSAVLSQALAPPRFAPLLS